MMKLTFHSSLISSSGIEPHNSFSGLLIEHNDLISFTVSWFQASLALYCKANHKQIEDNNMEVE